MLVGVVSDSHGNQAGLRRLAQRLKSLKVTTVLHLGDDYRDGEVLAGEGFEVLAVPGAFCPEYSRREIPNRLVVELAGVKMLLTHTPERHRLDLAGDPDPQAPAPGVQLVLFGHTHQPSMENRGGVLWLNPGHLRGGKDRGHPPTFALLRLSPLGVGVEIRALKDGSLIIRGKQAYPPQT
jgi:putative phosphoesterase